VKAARRAGTDRSEHGLDRSSTGRRRDGHGARRINRVADGLGVDLEAWMPPHPHGDRVMEEA
jgi:hypothetical protein